MPTWEKHSHTRLRCTSLQRGEAHFKTGSVGCVTSRPVPVSGSRDRLSLGNPGDAHALSGGVWELRIDYGPGYRVYYAQSGPTTLLVLCGGEKTTQAADIRQAQRYWDDYQRRKRDEQAH